MWNHSHKNTKMDYLNFIHTQIKSFVESYLRENEIKFQTIARISDKNAFGYRFNMTDIQNSKIDVESFFNDFDEIVDVLGKFNAISSTAKHEWDQKTFTIFFIF